MAEPTCSSSAIARSHIVFNAIAVFRRALVAHDLANPLMPTFQRWSFNVTIIVVKNWSRRMKLK